MHMVLAPCEKSSDTGVSMEEGSVVCCQATRPSPPKCHASAENLAGTGARVRSLFSLVYWVQ